MPPPPTIEAKPADSAALTPMAGGLELVLRSGLLVVLIYIFLVAVKSMSAAIGMLGSGATEGLFEGISSPFAGLAVGILSTALVQSSSVTTSTVVALVSAGSFGVAAAVPIVLGANIGTTITSTLVSLGSVAHKGEFRRAFAAGTMHDFFNLIAVAIFLPLELMTGFLAKSAGLLAGWFESHALLGGDASYSSPVKSAISWGAAEVQRCVVEGLGVEGRTAGVIILGVSFLALLLSLTLITRSMKRVMEGRAERAVNGILDRSRAAGVGMGAGLTMVVQSSSIVTSLMLPLCAGKVLTLRNAFPLVLGANIGTTITALLASLAVGATGFQIALVHLLFNGLAAALFFGVPGLGRLPVNLARRLSVLAVRSRVAVVIYLLVTFVLIPLGLMLVFE
ncbi:MAG: Na/Pi symporter [Planctomycetota bacterium]|nr:Na/Pi symporter [Planctomycetota bacterium]